MFYFSIATGELIGVEYLYAQTGKTLQNIPDQQEEVKTPVDAPDADDEDEGFHGRTYNNCKSNNYNLLFWKLLSNDTQKSP